jgi:hypothetical protein
VNTLTIRYDYREIAIVCLIGGAIGTAVWCVEHWRLPMGAWRDPWFWIVVVPIFCGIAALFRQYPAAQLTESAVTTPGYPFKIHWAQAHKCTVVGVLGAWWLKVYGADSRFPLWVPLPRTVLPEVYRFVEQHVNSGVVRTALKDSRLNEILRRTIAFPPDDD